MGIKHGIRPLSYAGVTAKNPPNMVVYKRNPTTKDCLGFELGTLWLYPVVNKIFVLTDKTAGVGTWMTVQTAGGGDDLQGMITDDANTTTGDIHGNITVSGGSNIETYQIGVNEYGIKTPANVVFGGSVTATMVNGGTVTGGIITGGALINRGVVRATITGTLYASKGNDGEVLVGGTGVDSIWANITAGAGITVTNGSNTIEIAATSAGNDLPVGIIMEDANGAPVGGSWLDCDGSIVSQATYPDLFARIGHNYLTPKFTLQVNPLGYIKGVAHNGQSGVNGLWVVLGSKNEIAKSQDGITWTPIASPAPAGSRSYAIDHNGQAGINGLWSIAIAGYIYSSNDLITWNTALVPSPSGNYKVSTIMHNRQAAPNGRWFVGFNNNSESYISTDGITWTKFDSIANYTYVTSNGFAYKDGVFVVSINGRGSLSYLAPGSTNWKSFRLNINLYREGSGAFYEDGITLGVASSNVLFMAISNSFRGGASQVYISKDGHTWKRKNELPIGEVSYPIKIAYTGGLFIIGSSTARIAASKDGNKWQEITSPFTTAVELTSADTISCISGNHLIGLDARWIITASDKIAFGEPAYNTATHFQLPNIPGSIILY